MIWLSTLACSSKREFGTGVLQMLALSFTRTDIAQVALPPACDSFQPSLGRTVKKDRLHAVIFSTLVGVTASLQSQTVLRSLNEIHNAFCNRRYAIYEAVVNPIVAASVSSLVAQWPCQTPNTPDLSHISNFPAYIKIGDAMKEKRRLFRGWYNNYQYFLYLERVGRIVAGLPLATMDVPIVSLISPCRTQTTHLYSSQQKISSLPMDPVFQTEVSFSAG